MSDKQKLPRHITAHESIDDLGVASKVFVLLKNTKTNEYYSVAKANSWDIKRGVIRLNKGEGWDKNKTVGKQIVF